MLRRIGAVFAATALLFALAVPASSAGSERSWEFVDIASSAEAIGINDRDDVVGWQGEYYYTSHAFVWEMQSGLTDLHEVAGLPDDTFSVAHDINNRGTIVGWRIGDYDTLVWNEHTGLVDVSPGFASDMANAINSQGMVVGGGSGLPAFIWSERTGFATLTPLAGTGSAEATAVNGRGQIAGRSGSHAVVWRPDGTVQDLGTFGGDFLFVTGINNRGQVVGYWFGFQLYSRGFLWDPHAGAVDLGEGFMPRSINDAGDIVALHFGSMVVMDGSGVVHTLPIPEGFVPYGSVNDINNRGVVVGQLYDAEWVEHAVMWVPSH